MKKANVDIIVVLAVALCATVLVGEFATYSTAWLGYGSDVEWSDGSVTVTISSQGTSAYDVVVIDNAKDVVLTMYIDDDYDTFYDEACKYSTIPYEDTEHYAEQIAGFLSLRSYDDVSCCRNDDLVGYLEGSMGRTGAALMVTSYALPSDVYDGTEGCLLLRWVEAGGSLYWISTEIGRFYTDSDGLHVVEDNQILFFGTECVNTSGGGQLPWSSWTTGSRRLSGFVTLVSPTVSTSPRLKGLWHWGIR